MSTEGSMGLGKGHHYKHRPLHELWCCTTLRLTDLFHIMLHTTVCYPALAYNYSDLYFKPLVTRFILFNHVDICQIRILSKYENEHIRCSNYISNECMCCYDFSVPFLPLHNSFSLYLQNEEQQKVIPQNKKKEKEEETKEKIKVYCT